MNHAQLRAFHAVARDGGFTAAARRLGLTQPALTVQVKALEQAYQVELFHRRGKSVRPTRAGQELYDLTRRIFQLEREAEDFLSAEGGLRRGRVRIAADGPFHVIAMIKAIRDALPAFEIAVAIGNSQSVVRALVDYEAEIGVLGEHALDDRFAVLAAARHALVLMIPPGHEWRGRAEVSIHELDGRPMVLREAGSVTRRAFDAALAASGVAPLAVLEIGSREAVREAVAAGLGLGVVQEPELGHDTRIGSARIGGADVAAGEFVICLEERRESRLIRRLTGIVAGSA
ncbi:MAG: LysR substrate-binding domain-containing protein [Alphaproteobacteria bacterium]